MLVGVLLKQLMRRGTLRVIDHRGKMHEYSGAEGPTVTIRLHDASLSRRLFWNPRLIVGEAYMDGSLTIEDVRRSLTFSISSAPTSTCLTTPWSCASATG